MKLPSRRVAASPRVCVGAARWLYRIRPSVLHTKLKRVGAGDSDSAPLLEGDFSKLIADPNQMRWAPMPLPRDGTSVDFEQGMRTMGAYFVSV